MKILVSACLLGECCKYNGGHNGCESVYRLADEHELVPVCPECLGGLPTPRPPAEIVVRAQAARGATQVARGAAQGAAVAAQAADGGTQVATAAAATAAAATAAATQVATQAARGAVQTARGTAQAAAPWRENGESDTFSKAQTADGFARIVNREGEDVSDAFYAGARAALQIAQEAHVDLAILQPRSPSCGVHEVYDGTFSGALVPGRGVFAALLADAGIPACEPSELEDASVSVALRFKESCVRTKLRR